MGGIMRAITSKICNGNNKSAIIRKMTKESGKFLMSASRCEWSFGWEAGKPRRYDEDGADPCGCGMHNKNLPVRQAKK
jgi:hypothetical protein